MDFSLILSCFFVFVLILILVYELVDLLVKDGKYEKKYNELVKLYDFTLVNNGLSKDKELLKYLKYINCLNKEEYEQLKLDELKERLFREE